MFETSPAATGSTSRARKITAGAASVSAKAILCYEAGYDAFWLARFLQVRGIECLVVYSASMQVNRRSRRVKTDRIDLGKLLRALIAWCGGERHVWSVVRIPSIDEEEALLRRGVEQELLALGYPVSRSSEGERLSDQRRR